MIIPPLSADLQKDAVQCDCGCNQFDRRARMTIVQAKYHEHSGTEHRVAGGRRWTVRKAHETDFRRELEQLSALKSMVDALEHAKWWQRIPYGWILYRTKVQIDQRTKGKRKARRGARRWVIVACAPEWLAEWYVAWTKKRDAKAAR